MDNQNNKANRTLTNSVTGKPPTYKDSAVQNNDRAATPDQSSNQMAHIYSLLGASKKSKQDYANNQYQSLPNVGEAQVISSLNINRDNRKQDGKPPSEHFAKKQGQISQLNSKFIQHSFVRNSDSQDMSQVINNFSPEKPDKGSSRPQQVQERQQNRKF